ncbi:MAG: CHAP domain-containing protein [Phenylobacterium sp.]|uniref:CHAP domain-containing protein n=1 Tax=Phenylobacterium sp. TaxID=1871053 RepID=UPI00273408CA|nr:CHAP domain-containing protein [Phenylobacterium sp.]MDP3174671.1 CHAP domain-containing protein [Phenylobacterium sp.]
MVKRKRTVLGSLAVAAALSLAPASNAFADTYWQCVPFARLLSGIQIFGDAWTWWRQAAGKYETGFQPKTGAVLCFKPTGKMKLGHVAVVNQVLTERVIQISHANWSRIDGTRGQIEKDVTVVDVSPQGDWSAVKVWYDPVRDLGGSTYPTFGFIYQDTTSRTYAASGLSAAQNTAISMAQSAASMAQSAASQMVTAARPGAGPMQMLSQAADSSDRIAALIQAATQGSKNQDNN